MRLSRIAWAVVCLCAAPAGAVEVSPIYGLQVLGGQYFFGGDKGNLSGNVNGVVAPALKFNERWSLLPSLNSSYQGTKTVMDLVGAGTLFQEQMDHRLSARAVYAPEDSQWRFKPSANFKYQLLKETRDEDWGKGLFDYRKHGLGFEAEYIYKEPYSFRAGLDVFQVTYPNYRSLEAQAAATAAGARQLAGDRVLDNDNAALSMSVDGPLTERLIGEANAYQSYSRFGDQHVVDGTGAFTNPVREDLATSVSVGVKMPTELNSDLRILPGLSVGGSYVSSNQNNYDAARVQYIPYYYNYGELRVSPSFKALIGPARQPIVASIAGSYSYRRYPHRLTQDASGIYQSSTIRTSNWTVAGSLTYPMAKHFNLLFSLQHGRSTSNQKYEQFYKYSYNVTNYLVGFSYDY